MQLKLNEKDREILKDIATSLRKLSQRSDFQENVFSSTKKEETKLHLYSPSIEEPEIDPEDINENARNAIEKFLEENEEAAEGQFFVEDVIPSHLLQN